MGEALYLDDCYLKEFDAEIVDIKDEKYVILDKTAFYPASGGQPHDGGKLICGNSEYNVVFVKKFEEKISHEVDKPGLKIGDKIHGVIDWDKRYKLMRMHTASHVLCSVINEESGAMITGNQLGEDKTRIDFSLEDFDREKINDYIKKVNQIIKENMLVKISYMNKEEAEKLSKLKITDYGDLEELRMIDVGTDIQPCGGCHVKNISEIGEIELESLENKGKDRKRMYFKLKR